MTAKGIRVACMDCGWSGDHPGSTLHGARCGNCGSSTMARMPDETTYCKARTRQQDFGSSYASSSWSCSRKATSTYKGLPVCKQHKDMLIRDQGPEKEND